MGIVFGLVGLCAMAHVQAKDIRTRKRQIADDLAGVRTRAKRGDDLDMAFHAIPHVQAGHSVG